MEYKIISELFQYDALIDVWKLYLLLYKNISEKSYSQLQTNKSVKYCKKLTEPNWLPENSIKHLFRQNL